ncbi:MAG TPA: glycosyl hydrolase family 28-related protein [Verrucomicrobiae bacterium]
MKFIPPAAVLLVFVAQVVRGASPTVEFYETAEEFVGPFASWKNLRRDFGAKGDGVTDDTAAWQRALDALKPMPEIDWSVLYVPAGTYRLTAPLETKRGRHADYLGFSIVGEDPANTTLIWDGPAGRNMVNLDAWYCKLSRLTFDGKGTAGVGLMRDGSFSTYCELSDLIFKDVKTGVSFAGGRGDAGQAEHAVLRCRFFRCSSAGVATVNFNSLDIYVWHCLFEDCANGIYNVMGGYHAYENVFLRSKQRDLRADNLCVFAWVNNVSVGSKCFFDMVGHTWPSPMLVQNNRVYDFTGPFAMRTGNAGSQVLIDNTIVTETPGDSRRPIYLAAGDQLLLGNRSNVKNPVDVTAADARKGRYRVIDTEFLEAASANRRPELKLPRTPAKRLRKVFEFRPGSGDDARTLQAEIDAACSEPRGSRPVVHIPRGTFSLNRTVTIPSGKDIQLVGDGPGENGTTLTWNGSSAEALLRLEGPSRAALRDFGINAPNGLIVTHADQPGGRVYANQLNLSGTGGTPDKFCDYAVFVDGVESSDVTLLCGGLSECHHGISVRGGPLLSADREAPGQVNVLSGASSHGRQLFEVTEGGRLVAEAYWYESDWEYPSPFVDLAGRSGVLTVAAMPWAVNTRNALLSLAGFSGTFAFLANNIGQQIYRLDVAGEGANCRFLCLCNSFNMAKADVTAENVWADSSKPAAQAALANCNYWGDKTGQIPNIHAKQVGAEPDESFIRNSLRQLRSVRIEPLTNRPAGVTDVQITRLRVAGAGGKLVQIRR